VPILRWRMQVLSAVELLRKPLMFSLSDARDRLAAWFRLHRE